MLTLSVECASREPMDVDVEEVDADTSSSGSESSELPSLKGIPMLSLQESSRLILDESMPFCSLLLQVNHPKFVHTLQSTIK